MMKPAHVCLASLAFLFTGCFGLGVKQTKMLERHYGMPMKEILEKERPKQMREQNLKTQLEKSAQ